MRRRLEHQQVDLWFLTTEDTTYARLVESRERMGCLHDSVESNGYAASALRRAFLMRRTFLRIILSQYADVPPEAWSFRRDRFGKPEIMGPALGKGPAFSLSKTEGLMACAVASSRPVGVDAEAITDNGDADEIAQRFFAPSENAALARLSLSERRQRFFELWSLKEAYSKALGLGLRLSFDAISFAPTGNGHFQAAFGSAVADDPQDWVFSVSRPNDRHLLSLAVARRPDEARNSWRDNIELTVRRFERAVLEEVFPRPNSCTNIAQAPVRIEERRTIR